RENDGILLELSRRLLAAPDEASVGTHVVEIVALAFHASQALLALPEADGRLVLQAAWGRANDPSIGQVFEPGSQSQIGHTIAQNQPMITDGFTAPVGFVAGSILAGLGSAASLSVPLLLEARQTGALLVASRE